MHVVFINVAPVVILEEQTGVLLLLEVVVSRFNLVLTEYRLYNTNIGTVCIVQHYQPGAQGRAAFQQCLYLIVLGDINGCDQIRRCWDDNDQSTDNLLGRFHYFQRSRCYGR